MDSFDFDDSVFETSGMSESRSMDESGFRPNFGEQFVKILRATGMNEDLLPNCNEINEEIESMAGSEEFVEWFCNTITLSNVVTEEELKISEELKDVPMEEINAFLEQTLGDQQDKCPVTREIIDQMVAEEAMCNTQFEVIQRTKELLQSKLDAQAEQKKSLLLSTNKMKRELRTELNSVAEVYQDVEAKCEKLLETFNIFLKKYDNEVEDAVEVQNSITNMDLSKFYELNKVVMKEFKETLTHYESFNNSDEQRVCSAMAMNLIKPQGSESEGPDEANGLLLQYVNSKIKSEEKKVEFVSILSLLAQQSHSCNQIISFLYETEVKQTNVVLNLIKILITSLKANLNIELLPSLKLDSKNNEELMLAANLQSWNEILTGSTDFVTIKEFVESLKDFNQKLTDCESRMNEYILKLNQLSAKSMNIVKNSLMIINQELEGPIEVSCVKRLESYIESIHEASEQLKKIKIEAEKKKSLSSVYEDTLLNGLTDFQNMQIKIEELERKVKLLVSASNI